MTLPPLNIGIIGLGAIGRIHVDAISRLPELASVTGVARANDAALAEVGLDPSLRMDVAELIRNPNIDIISVCTPSASHAELAVEALNAGKHVVVEKPLAVTSQDAARIVAMGRNVHRSVSVISQRRLESQNIALRELLADGSLGQPVIAVVTVPWFRDSDYYAAAAWRRAADGGGGSLANQGLHSIDLLLMLLGRVTLVTGQSTTIAHDIQAEDTTAATLKFASGAFGVIGTTTAVHPGYPARMSVYTTTGSFELEGDSLIRWDFPSIAAPSAGDSIPGGDGDPMAIGLHGHVAQWRDIAKAVRDGKEPSVTGEDGLHTVEVIEAIYESAHSQRSVSLPAKSS